MKSFNFSEFNSYVHWAADLLSGAQLQNVWTHDRGLVFEFYKFKNLWLFLDLDARFPQVILLQNEAPTVVKKSKPLGLFLNSHGKNLRVESFISLPMYGRVAVLKLAGGGKSCLVEMQLVPNHSNILVIAGDKKISWEKPLALPKVPIPNFEIIKNMDEQWLHREQEWKSSLNTTTVLNMSSEKKARSLEKKEKALNSLLTSLEKLNSETWKKLGEQLKTHQEISDHLLSLLDSKLSRSGNIERSFQMAKDVERKRIGTLERIEKIKLEIEFLKNNPQSVAEPQSLVTKTLRKAEARGRKLQLGNGLEAVCGKSARDNLAILRQARSWDLWLHLKDYPGAHAIIFRDRNIGIDPATIEKVACWLIEESPAAKSFTWGVKFDVVAVECRFVRPIKGDAIGRVTYHNPQVYTFASKKRS